MNPIIWSHCNLASILVQKLKLKVKLTDSLSQQTGKNIDSLVLLISTDTMIVKGLEGEGNYISLQFHLWGHRILLIYHSY